MTKSLNNGILSRKAAPVRWADIHGTNYVQDPEVIMVPLWKAIVIMIGTLAMTASFVYSVRPAPEAITAPPQSIRSYLPEIAHQYPDEGVCKPIPSLSHKKSYQQAESQIAAAVPASALKPWGK